MFTRTVSSSLSPLGRPGLAAIARACVYARLRTCALLVTCVVIARIAYTLHHIYRDDSDTPFCRERSRVARARDKSRKLSRAREKERAVAFGSVATGRRDRDLQTNAGRVHYRYGCVSEFQ